VNIARWLLKLPEVGPASSTPALCVVFERHFN